MVVVGSSVEGIEGSRGCCKIKSLVAAGCSYWSLEDSRVGGATETSGGKIAGTGGGTLGGCGLIKTGRSGAATGCCCF